MDFLRQDLRFALRIFRRSPAFTAVAVMTLAIGIGANTAIFSAVDAMLLRPLPFPEPDRLMKVSLIVPPRHGEPVRDDMVWSFPKARVLREAQTVFDAVSLWSSFQATVGGVDGAERLRYEMTDSRYLPVLGIRPALGRGFAADEDVVGAPRVAMLSDAFWGRRFNGDSAVLGQTLTVNGNPYTIVGVMPAGFRGLSGEAEFWLPIVAQPDMGLDQPWSHSFWMIARLKEGVSVGQAQTVVRELGPVVDRAFPHPEISGEAWGAIARELDATRVDPVIRRSLLILLGAVGLVLLIACANVANLFLVRAAGRRREIAVRLAIGAGRARLVQQLVTESVVLAAIGGIASLGIAWVGVRLLAAFEPASALRSQAMSGIGAVNFSAIRLDLTAFAFAMGLTLLTALLFGLVPALQATRPSVTGALKGDADRASRRTRRALSSRNLLVVAEISLALILLAGSGLMIRSLANILGVRSGVDVENVLTMRMTPPIGFARDSLPGFYDEVLARLGALPGVTGVALSDCPPLTGPCNGTVVALRDRPPAAPGTEPLVGVHWITPDWPTVMRLPLRQGRLFTNADRLGVQKVVIVTETAARTLWPGEDPIGKPVSVGQGGFWNDTARVVGVVGDVRYDGFTNPVRPEVYLPYAQSPSGRLMLFLRTNGDPVTVIPAARQVIAELAPGVPVFEVRTMEARAGDAMSFARFSTLLLALFAAVALALATMGTYGVIAFAVAQRTREIGIRVALGATRSDVIRLVVGQGLALAVIGGVIGVAAAIAATRVLSSLLYDVAPSDPPTFAAIVIILTGAVALASWLPARRAATIDPTVALREE